MKGAWDEKKRSPSSSTFSAKISIRVIFTVASPSLKSTGAIVIPCQGMNGVAKPCLARSEVWRPLAEVSPRRCLDQNPVPIQLLYVVRHQRIQGPLISAKHLPVREAQKTAS